VFLMFGLPLDTWIRLAVWLAIGLAIYFAYGRKHSRLSR
jgi:basic amino acid/polyamine antiporter, APA family